MCLFYLEYLCLCLMYSPNMGSCMVTLPQLQPLTLAPQVQGLTVVTLLYAAVAGDVTALHRHFLQVGTVSLKSYTSLIQNNLCNPLLSVGSCAC